jgi:ribose 1,5-bisphosphate isomerase
VCTQAVETDATDAATLRAEVRVAARRLHATRPTAVSLPNALRYVLDRMEGEDPEAVRESVVAASEEFRARLDRAQADLGAVGANRLGDGDTVMTHCHSTDVLSCIEAARDQGKSLSAVVKETRPRKQGHITAGRLRELDVPVTLVVDGAARRYLDEVDHVFVGADSIAADGSVVNKIGTSGLAVLARERDTPVVVAAATLKLDPATLSGATVDIETREESEVLPTDERAEVGDVSVANPAFDVTPPRYVDAIVTERGQFPPESIVVLMRELYGTDPSTPWEE